MLDLDQAERPRSGSWWHIQGETKRSCEVRAVFAWDSWDPDIWNANLNTQLTLSATILGKDLEKDIKDTIPLFGSQQPRCCKESTTVKQVTICDCWSHGPTYSFGHAQAVLTLVQRTNCEWSTSCSRALLHPQRLSSLPDLRPGQVMQRWGLRSRFHPISTRDILWDAF